MNIVGYEPDDSKVKRKQYSESESLQYLAGYKVGKQEMENNLPRDKHSSTDAWFAGYNAARNNMSCSY